METLDLFKDWTPEMIAALKYQGQGHGQGRLGMSNEEVKEWEERARFGKKMSEIQKACWAGLSTEERREKIKAACGSDKAQLGLENPTGLLLVGLRYS